MSSSEWLYDLENILVDDMSFEKSKTFHFLFLEAIPVGVDLEQIKTNFLIYVLEKALTTFYHDKSPALVANVKALINLYKSDEKNLQKFKTISDNAWMLYSILDNYHRTHPIISVTLAVSYGDLYGDYRIITYIADACCSVFGRSYESIIDEFADKLLELLKNAK